MVFRARTADRKTETVPTVILLGGNCQLYEHCEHEVALYSSMGYDVVGFNFRGIGASTGVVSQHGTVLDGCSVVQFVHQKLDVPMCKICLVGHSIGGSVATAVASVYPDLRLCADRTFESMQSTVRYHVFSWQELMPVLGPHVWGFLAALAAAGARYAHWNYSTQRWWEKVQGFKWSVSIRNDRVIPPHVQLRNEGGRTIVMDPVGDGHNRSFRKGREMQEQAEMLRQAFTQTG